MTKYMRGAKIECRTTIKDSDDNLVTPTTLTLEIIDVVGTIIETKEITSLTEESTGVYTYLYPIPVDATYGDWQYKFTGTTPASTVVYSKYFTVDAFDSGLYCSILDVYRKAGIDSTVISNEDVADHIRDADAEIDELYGKSFGNAQSITEWFDTLDDDIESIESDEISLLFLRYLPVQTITSVEEYDTSNTLVKTWASDEYWLDTNVGTLRLIEDSFVNQVHRVKVVYTYGASVVPRKIRKLSSIISAIGILLQQMGGTYDDVTSYSLPTGVSIGVGEPYMNMRTAMGELDKELKRTLDTIGRLKTNSVVI